MLGFTVLKAQVTLGRLKALMLIWQWTVLHFNTTPQRDLFSEGHVAKDCWIFEALYIPRACLFTSVGVRRRCLIPVLLVFLRSASPCWLISVSYMFSSMSC